MATCLYEGYLKKRAIVSGRNWRKRYIRVFADEITYCKRQNSKKTKGSLTINQDSRINANDKHRKHCFEFSEEGEKRRVLIAQCPTQERRDHWVALIKSVITKIRDRIEMQIKLQNSREEARRSEDERKEKEELAEKLSLFEVIMRNKFRPLKLFAFGENEFGQLGNAERGQDKVCVIELIFLSLVDSKFIIYFFRFFSLSEFF
eukprot:TRINITY_DN6760_c0_g1_i2.p1 TRINITY_DN6760_c0_g1~~TRINITY_DN6760_c0_g1_i2.p1  ORF type:complete len:219 (-),score=21.00 TRINITY_DN6760_c0_g1_i2:71-682(-)